MVGLAASGLQITAVRPSIFFTHRIFKSAVATVFNSSNVPSSVKRSASLHVSSLQPFQHNLKSTSARNYATKANSEASEGKPASVLPIDLTGKRAFIAGVADDNGYGWAIAKSLAAAGAEILVGTWVPALNIFETSLRRGKFDESRV